jgi:hypothetical protein
LTFSTFADSFNAIFDAFQFTEYYNVDDVPINATALDENMMLVSGASNPTGIDGSASRNDAEIVQLVIRNKLSSH